MTAKNNGNRSLVLYTSLIFIVALIMIIVSFFAQTHLDHSKVSEIDAEKVDLSNKAAQVSEENMQLIELNRTLRNTNAELSEEINSVKTQNEELSKSLSGYRALSEVCEKLLGGNKKAAKTLLQNIYTEDLSKDQKELYDMLVKKIQ